MNKNEYIEHSLAVLRQAESTTVYMSNHEEYEFRISSLFYAKKQIDILKNIITLKHCL